MEKSAISGTVREREMGGREKIRVRRDSKVVRPGVGHENPSRERLDLNEAILDVASCHPFRTHSDVSLRELFSFWCSAVGDGRAIERRKNSCQNLARNQADTLEVKHSPCRLILFYSKSMCLSCCSSFQLQHSLCLQ
jgi:hypothetical protein